MAARSAEVQSGVRVLRILGIAAKTHDSGVAFVRNGVPELILEEERFNRTKKTKKFPRLALAAGLSELGLEIDDIDEERESGWSVLVLGSAERVTREYTLTSLWKDGPVPWAEGTRNLFIMITPDTITGRIVGQPAAD